MYLSLSLSSPPLSLSTPQHKVTGDPLVWFMFQKTKYIYEEEKKQFSPVVFPVACHFSDYLSSPGYEGESQLAAAKQIYGKNTLVQHFLIRKYFRMM